MPITPLHLAYAWPIKMRYRSLNFGALTIGSMIPDVEVVLFFLFGIHPNRLVTHSLLGAFTVDPVLTIIACYILHRLRVNRIGIAGFEVFRVDGKFVFSAIAGVLTHVLVDYTHHEFNPVLWPFGPTYIVGPLVEVVGVLGAHAIAHAASLLILLYLVKILLKRKGKGLGILLSNPRLALELVTGMLSSSH